MKSVIAHLEGKFITTYIDGTKTKDKGTSSGGSYSLQINTSSPSNTDGQDQFKFNTNQREKDGQIKKNIRGAYLDRVYLTPENILRLFRIIDVD